MKANDLYSKIRLPILGNEIKDDKTSEIAFRFNKFYYILIEIIKILISKINLSRFNKIIIINKIIN